MTKHVSFEEGNNKKVTTKPAVQIKLEKPIQSPDIKPVVGGNARKISYQHNDQDIGIEDNFNDDDESDEDDSDLMSNDEDQSNFLNSDMNRDNNGRQSKNHTI